MKKVIQQHRMQICIYWCVYRWTGKYVKFYVNLCVCVWLSLLWLDIETVVNTSMLFLLLQGQIASERMRETSLIDSVSQNRSQQVLAWISPTASSLLTKLLLVLWEWKMNARNWMTATWLQRKKKCVTAICHNCCEKDRNPIGDISRLNIVFLRVKPIVIIYYILLLV